MNALVAIDLVLGVLALLAALPSAVFFVELLAASLRRDRPDEPIGAALPAGAATFAVLMPAHDEASGIGAAIAAARAQLRAGDRLLVVADNCSDATAAVALAAGAEVVERQDPVYRGKGHALDHGVRHLAASPPAVVIVLDADCIAGPGALPRLADACLRHGRPAQAHYRMDAPPGAGLTLRIAAFAWRVRNRLRPLGAAALGAPCQLMGTGMAFPWPMLRDAPLASADLVEDMRLGLDLAAAGTPPRFCPEAEVVSVFPLDADAQRSQRTRWEHGHLATLAVAGPRLLARGLLRGRPALIAMALDLMVPPLAALVLMLALLLLLAAIGWLVGGSAWPLFVAGTAMAMVVIGVVLAWQRAGRDLIGAREWLRMPLYVAAKLPIYARLFGRRQAEWVRTRRDGDHGR